MKLGEFIQSNSEARKHWRLYQEAKLANEALAPAIDPDGWFHDDTDPLALGAVALPPVTQRLLRDPYAVFICDRFEEYSSNLVAMSRAMQEVLNLYFRDRMETRLRQISNTTYTDKAAHNMAVQERLELRAILEAMNRPDRQEFPRDIGRAISMAMKAMKRK